MSVYSTIVMVRVIHSKPSNLVNKTFSDIKSTDLTGKELAMTGLGKLSTYIHIYTNFHCNKVFQFFVSVDI